MSDYAVRAYHLLPRWGRSAAVNLRGMYLRWWRYGPETERLAEQALERERWTAERWQAWQEERLAFVLHRAATRVPYYRELWRARHRKGDRRSRDVLAHWPVLHKDTLRAHPRAFVADDCRPWCMLADHTSGTTGTPLTLWRSRTTTRALFAIALARIRRWHGVSHHNAWAMFGGQLVTPVAQQQPPFWVWNAALRQLYVSTMHLAPRFVPHYLDALRRYGVVYLQGHASALHTLAQEALRLGRPDLDLRAVFTSAEPLSRDYRETIEAAFGCPARETYGCGESVVAGSECAAGSLHLWPEVGLVEVLNGTQPASPATSGDLVCTSLLDPDMPLIRYRLGDRGRLAEDLPACSCGRTLPRIAAIEGRSSDRLITPDGRRVYWLNPVFYGLPVREAQIVQDSLDWVRVIYVPAPGFTSSHAGTIVERLWARLGRMTVTLEQVARIPRGVEPKIRPVICRVTPDAILAGTDTGRAQLVAGGDGHS